jgi:[ribosomal protein S5]-alanine N-acetyltransferase
VRAAVELGYVVFTAHWRRGYAEEALTGLMRWALQCHGVTLFVVSISPDNDPLTKLAGKLGFRRIGQHVDPVDGIEYVYLREVG